MKKNRITIFIVAVLLSISLAFLLFSPFDEVVQRANEQNLGVALSIVAAFEVVFILGLLVMAGAVGHDLGKNPFRWRRELGSIVRKISEDRLFWIGFWINFVGAMGTTIILTWLVFTILPKESWGLALIGCFDLLVTVALRYEVLHLRE